MGKTSKPLVLLIHPSLADWPEIEELRQKGHTVQVMADLHPEPHVLLGPTCWYMAPALRKYLAVAVQQARKKLALTKQHTKEVTDQ